MSDYNSNPNPERSGGGTGLAFIVGGLVVAVAVIFWLVFGGGNDTATDTANDVNVTVENAGDAAAEAAEAAGDAADAVGEAATNAAEATGEAAREAADAAADAANQATGNN